MILIVVVVILVALLVMILVALLVMILVALFVMIVMVLVILIVVVVILVALLVMIVMIVMIVFRNKERDRFNMLRNCKHRCSGVLYSLQRVQKSSFKLQPVGHDKVGIVHAFPVLQRRLKSVGITADRNNRLNIGNSITSQIGDDICPDSRCRQHHRGVSCRVGRGIRRIRRVSTSSGHHRENDDREDRSQETPIPSG